MTNTLNQVNNDKYFKPSSWSIANYLEWINFILPSYLYMQINPNLIEIHLKIYFSKTTRLNETKLCWNDAWMVIFQTCVEQPSPQSQSQLLKNRQISPLPQHDKPMKMNFNQIRVNLHIQVWRHLLKICKITNSTEKKQNVC
jgi:hypothetical protein